MDWVEESSSSRSMSKVHEGRMTTTSSSTRNGPSHPHMTLYNSVIEEKIIIEQVDTGRERLAKERAERILEQFRQVSATIENLFEWLSSIEKELASLDVVRENVEECKRQVNIVKAIREDLDLHSEEVNSCLNQIRLLIATGTDVLSTEQISSLERYGKTLKTRYETCTEYSENLLRKLTSAYEELRKYKSEATTFVSWMEKSFRTLEEKERSIHSLNLSGREKVKEFVSDVVAHQGDLRFITMSAQTFFEESKEYLQVLNHYRSNNRLPTLREKESIIRQEVTSITNTYSELLSRANALFDKLAMGNRRQEFEDAVNRAMAWLKDVTPRAQKIISEPINPKQIDSQLSKAKALQYEVNTEGKRLIDSVRLATNNFLNLEELSAADRNAVNSTAKEIEHRYQSLVDSINEKVNSLESAADLLKKLLDNLKQLRQILEREEARCPKNIIPLNLAEIESTIRTYQSILDVLTENTSLLDNTRSSINELIRKRPAEAEISAIRDSFVEIEKRWKELYATCKQRMELLEAIKEFQGYYEHLTKWLLSKEKMINVLVGSISSEQRLITHQLQQIKLVRDEFRTEKPTLDLFNNSGDSILNKTNPTSSSGKKIDDQLVSVNSKWNELLTKLDDYAAALEDASGASNDFYNAYNKLAANLNKISDDLDDLAADKDADKDLLLRKLNDLAKQLAANKPLLNQVEDAGERLIDLLNDPASKADIRQKVGQVGKLFDNCQRKIDALREMLDSSKREAEEFADACRGLQQRLADLLSQLGDRLLISADRSILKTQVSQFEQVYRQILNEETKVTSTIRKGKELASKSTTEQRRSIQQNLDLIQNNWDRLKKEADKRNQRLTNSMDLCIKYDRISDTFIKWLESAERKLESLRLHEFKKNGIDRQLQELNTLRSEVSRHTNEYESTRGSGQGFLDSTDKDKEVVTRELQEIKIRWDALNNALSARIRQLEDFASKLGEFNGHVADVKKVLDKCEDKLNNTDIKDPNVLQKLKAIAEEAARLEQPLNVVQIEGDGLCNLADGENCDSGHIKDAVDDLLNRYGALQDRLDGRGNELEAAAAALALFMKRMKALSNDLNGLEDELNNMKGIGRDIPTVKGQIKEMETFNRKVLEKRKELEQTTAETADLIRRGVITDAPAVKTQIDNMKKHLTRIETKADTRSTELDKTLKRLEDFYKLYHSTDGQVNELIRDEATLFRVGIGGDVESIKALQRQFDDFRSRKVAPVGKLVEEVNKLGFALIASASPSVNTTGLKADLDKLNDKWNGLKKSLADRQRALEEALLKSGNFKDAVQKFLAWLRQMDGLLVDDGKIHGDVDTVTGLIKEHKKIEDQVNSRRVQMEEIIRTGESMLEGSTSVEERTKISTQIREVKTSYESVKSKVVDKSRRLDGALKEAHQLNKAVTSMLDWLSNAEKKKQKLSVPLPDDERATAKLLDEQETFLREISNKEADKNATIELARSILAKAHPNAVNIIKHWIATIQSKWDEISNWAQQRHEKLLAHLNSLRDNEKFLDELLAWLKKKQDTLVRLETQILPDNMDQLKELILEHNEFMREVMRRNLDVDSVCKPKGAAPLLRQGRGTSPTARIGAKSDLFPHIGPRFEGQNFHHKSSRSKTVWDTWKDVWQLCWDRQRRLREKYNRLVELSKIKPFSWDDWRKRFLKHMNHNKERVKGLFTKFDRHNNGLIPRERFTGAINDTNFPQTDAEMEAVADMFEQNNLVNYPEFIAALRPDWRDTKPVKEDVVINDEIERQVNKCTCKQKFRVYQVAEGQYRFGESQKLRLVRVLRSTVMVRVGGGWVTLEEFLQKNDPCRVAGRTNFELRDQLNWNQDTSLQMQAFTAKRRPGSRTQSPGPIKEVQERGIRTMQMTRARSIERQSSPDSYSSRHRHPSSDNF